MVSTMPAPQDSDSAHLSGAFFCPQAYAPDEEYLNGLHSFLSESKHGKSLLREISDLKDSHIWSTFATASGDVASLSAGPEYIDLLYNWAAKGASGPLAAARSSVVALPLLVILQVGQYLRFLTTITCRTRRSLSMLVRPAASRDFVVVWRYVFLASIERQ
jgi:hypothetical protein